MTTHMDDYYNGEDMEQTAHAPRLLGPAKLLGIKAQGSFHGKHMADQSFIFDVFTNKR